MTEHENIHIIYIYTCIFYGLKSSSFSPIYEFMALSLLNNLLKVSGHGPDIQSFPTCKRSAADDFETPRQINNKCKN